MPDVSYGPEFISNAHNINGNCQINLHEFPNLGLCGIMVCVKMQMHHSSLMAFIIGNTSCIERFSFCAISNAIPIYDLLQKKMQLSVFVHCNLFITLLDYNKYPSERSNIERFALSKYLQFLGNMVLNYVLLHSNQWSLFKIWNITFQGLSPILSPKM